jgi:hypothetical protein
MNILNLRALLAAAALSLAVAAPVTWNAGTAGFGWNDAQARRGGQTQSSQPGADDPAGHDALDNSVDDNGATPDTSGHHQRRRGR